MGMNRTTKDVETMREVYRYHKNDLPTLFEDAPATEFDLVNPILQEISVSGDRFDRLVRHGWIEVDMENGTYSFTMSGFVIGKWTSRRPEWIEDLSVPDFMEKAGNHSGLKL